MKNFFINLTLMLLTSIALGQKSPLNRKYKLGDTYQYKLTCTELHNGVWESTIISVCELKVIKDSSGVFYDQVKWINKQMLTKKDTIDQTDKAFSVKPYQISLDKKGKLDLPKITVSSMTEPIQDFNTFFVAVSPQLGTTTLKKVGDTITKSDLIKADFSNGSFILKGDDCFLIKLLMSSKTSSSILTEAHFLPPSKICFPYLLDEMNISVVDGTINNFQMVQPTSDTTFNVHYGKEEFIIRSETSKKDGKIIIATMDNTLNLKLKINCNKDYKDSQFETPFIIQRNLKLELISNAK
jgi:hypothetical protein